MMMLRPSGGNRWKRIDPRVFGAAQNKEEKMAFKVVQGWLGERYVPNDGDEVSRGFFSFLAILCAKNILILMICHLVQFKHQYHLVIGRGNCFHAHVPTVLFGN